MKGYTDLEQSKKLAEILPVESADMHYSKDYDGSWFVDFYKYTSVKIPKYVGNVEEHLLPCWSLTALLDVLIAKDFDPETMFLRSTSDGRGTRLTNVWRLSVDRLDVDISLRDIYADSLVDACVGMILRLNELKML